MGLGFQGNSAKPVRVRGRVWVRVRVSVSVRVRVRVSPRSSSRRPPSATLSLGLTLL